MLLKGLLLGFAIAAPVGPIGVLCIRKTIQFGRWSGFFTGLGAAVADTFYGALAIFGLTVISDFFISYQVGMQRLGGLFLAYLGIKVFRSKLAPSTQAVTHKTLLKDFLITFVLTLTNPMTIVSFLLIFAGFGIAHETSSENILFILGVFLGSATWWLILSEGITFFRKKMSPAVIQWINRGAGILLICFSLRFLWGAF